VTTRVTFSVPHTTWDGTAHQPDTTADLSALEARHVLTVGHGRAAEPAAPDADATDTTQGEDSRARRNQKKEKADG